MLEARNLTKNFVRQVAEQGDKKSRKKKMRKETFTAVNGVSLCAKPGQILGVLGPNGAGKTTLLRMMGYLMEPTSGEVVLTDERLMAQSSEDRDETNANDPAVRSMYTAEAISGEPFSGEEYMHGTGKPDMTAQTQSIITDRKECKKRISYLSENTKLYPRFTVRELLAMIGALYEYDKETVGHRIGEIASVMRMEAFLDNRIDKLSTGQKQRTSIARCLIADPEIYILDEPTLGLDVISAEAIVRFMKQEKEKGKCVLYSTHYMEEAEALCDRVVIIRDGVIIAEGAPAELNEQAGKRSLREAFFTLIGADTEE